MTPEQARRILENVPPGTPYYRMATEVLNPGQRPAAILGIDAGLDYRQANDDDGDGI